MENLKFFFYSFFASSDLSFNIVNYSVYIIWQKSKTLNSIVYGCGYEVVE